jgi:hypothetical protein
MQSDIEKKVLKDFKEKKTALNYLKDFELKNNFPDRVTRCVVFLSNGNLETLKKNIKIAQDDWRDIIYYAEKFNFQYNTPFSEE